MKDLRCLMGLHSYIVQRIEGEHRAYPRTYQECRRRGHVRGGLDPEGPVSFLGGTPPSGGF